MDKDTELIYKRNILLVRLLWAGLVLDCITIFFFYHREQFFELFPVPALAIVCLVATFIATRKSLIRHTAYILIFIMYAYLFMLLQSYTFLWNFIFVWVVLVLSSLYQNTRLILFTGFLTVGFSNYFFFLHKAQLFPNSQNYEAAFLSLVGILITVILVVTSKFSEGLRLQAQNNELVAIGQLKTTTQHLNSFIESTTDAVQICDKDGIVLSVNSAFAKMYGWDSKEIIGQKSFLLPKETLKDSIIDNSFLDLHELTIKKKDGSTIDVSMSLNVIKDDLGNIVKLAFITRDITEKRRVEIMLLKSDKLSSVGQLAAGVAHEVRNPLTVIKGFLQLLSDKSTQEQEYFKIIFSELRRIEEIISEFLMLARPQQVDMKQVSLKNLLEITVLILGPQAILKNVNIHIECPPNIPNLECVEHQIKQVFVNFIKNAIESMPTGGNIFIDVKMNNTDKVAISIVDEGPGMTKEQILKLGEPFFTTKEKGNGLGLMVSYKIIHNHKGYINVSSIIGKGTTFEITLPISQKKIS